MRPLMICALQLASISLAGSQTLPPELPAEQATPALRTAEAIGRAIFLHDHGAAVANDAVRELGAFDADELLLRGWVAVLTLIGATPSGICGDAGT